MHMTFFSQGREIDNRTCHTSSDFARNGIRWSLYHTESKSKVTAKSANSISPTSFAQPALSGFSGRAGWAELVGQIEQADLTVTLDFYFVWYRDHLIPFRAKYEQKFFGLTGPNIQVHTLKPRYNERRYSEFHNIVNKTQLSFWGFT